MNCNIIEELKQLLHCSPLEVYTKIYNQRGINIRNKVAILAACLHDKRQIDFGEEDPRSRNVKIEKNIKT